MSERLIVDNSPPMDEYSKFYSVNYYCKNCTHYGYAYFKKGTRKHRITCTKCECGVDL